MVIQIEKKQVRDNYWEEPFYLNIGPQHPSTHGVLRLRVELEGETIKKCEPIIGYLHRGIEKLAESFTPNQCIVLSDRLDYICGICSCF